MATTLTRADQAARVTPGDGFDRRWWGLAVIATAQLMIALDATVVNIALPSAQAALGFGDADRQWVVTAYTLALGGLLLLGGRIADSVVVGRRRALVIGLVGFAAASALSGAAGGLGMLVGARALQGAFAALLAPTALSSLALMFTEPRERARAFGIYGAIAASGGAIGLLLGGVLTQYLSWRWCLYLNVPIALAAAVAARALLPDPRKGDSTRRTPEGLPPEGLTLTGVDPAGLSPEGMTPAGLAPAGLTPSGLTPEGLTPSGLTPEGVTPEGMPLEGSLPAGLAPAGSRPSGRSPSGLTPSGLTPESFNPRRVGPGKASGSIGPKGFDVLGLLLGSGGLVAVVLGCGQAARWGWGAPQVLLLFVLGALALGVFVWWEARSEAPLLPLGIVLDRQRGAAYASALLAAAGMFGAFLFLTYTLQVGMGFSPLQAGLAFLPMTASSVLAGTLVAPRLLLRVSPRVVMVTGFVLAAGGMLALTRLQAGSDYATGLLPAEILLGLGIASVMMPASQLATSRVDQRTAGMASATLNSAQQVGASLGTTVLNTVAATATAAFLASSSAATSADGLLHGYATAAFWGALVLVVGAAVALTIPSNASRQLGGNVGAHRPG